jgi:hypothetical protein
MYGRFRKHTSASIRNGMTEGPLTREEGRNLTDCECGVKGWLSSFLHAHSQSHCELLTSDGG